MANSISALILLSMAVAIIPVSAQEATQLPLDVPTRVGDMGVVCTGAGLDARQTPAWSSYLLKIEIAGRGGQYLGDVILTLTHGGRELAKVHCDGPWVLFRAPPGRYRVEAQTEGKSVKSGALVPESGQGRVVLRFPELGGETGPAPAAPPS